MLKLILTLFIMLFSTNLFAKDYMLIYFTSKNCVYCRRLEQTMKNPEIQNLLKSYSFVTLDLASPEGKKLKSEYRVDLVPTLYIMRYTDRKNRKGVPVRKSIGAINLEQLKEFLTIRKDQNGQNQVFPISHWR